MSTSYTKRNHPDIKRPPPRSTEDKWVHDAFTGQGRRGSAAPTGPGRHVADVAGTGAAFTGVSPRIEVVGLHYEVTPQDLKVGGFFGKLGKPADQRDNLLSGWNISSRPNYPCKRLIQDHPLSIRFAPVSKRSGNMILAT